MDARKLLIFCVFLIYHYTKFGKCGELLRARCHAKCLHEFEHRSANNSEVKKHLKHHLINLCKEDPICSSCSLPCGEAIEDTSSNCQKSVCNDAKDVDRCRASCYYLQRIYAEKPGHCSKDIQLVPTDECSASCHLDGDCLETEKCCSLGCSRLCLKPISQDRHLINTPIAVTVQERKRKRSVIVRWVVQQMSREQAATNSNLYVLQWRWSIHKADETMTDWQTIVVRNKLHAILKHLLAPGRYYSFRVAAVNSYGSKGFSNASEPFKPSKEPKAPAEPKNISLGKIFTNFNGLWNQEIHWLPANSELPIKNFFISWYKSSNDQASIYEKIFQRNKSSEKQEKRSAMNIIYNDEDDSIDSTHTSTVVPSYRTSATVENLEGKSTYFVEVHASVDSSDGELHGEKAVIILRTPASSVQSLLVTTKLNESFKHSSDSKQMPITGDLIVKSPYFEDGVLKTIVSWLDSQYCSSMKSSFVVRWRLLACQLNDEKQRTYYDLDTSGRDWAKVVVSQCVAILDDLNFSCSYFVEIKREGNDQIVNRGHFKTESCELTPSKESFICELHRNTSSRLRCKASMDRPSAFCAWQTLERSSTNAEAIIGYRIVLTAPLTAVGKIIINPPHQQNIQFDELEPATEYSVHVQAITSNGLAEMVAANFETLSTITALSKDIDLKTSELSHTFETRGAHNSDFSAELNSHIDYSSRQVFIELPLAGSASTTFKNNSLVYVLFFCYFTYYMLYSLELWLR